MDGSDEEVSDVVRVDFFRARPMATSVDQIRPGRLFGSKAVGKHHSGPEIPPSTHLHPLRAWNVNTTEMSLMMLQFVRGKALVYVAVMSCIALWITLVPFVSTIIVNR